MIPIKNDCYEIIDVDATVDTYEANEIRFIRTKKEKIIEQAKKVHDKRILNNNVFLNKTCCDFQKLEISYQNFNIDLY